MASFVLVHSPLVSAITWSLVADELRRAGHQVMVPSLFTGLDVPLPYWQQHAQAVESTDAPPILVGHSGAGPLLPAIRQTMNRSVAGYIFADADLPRDAASRLDLFDSAEDVRQFREAAVNGLLPVWGDDDLRDLIPDDTLRHRFVADLRPLPLAVYEEPLPVYSGWPDTPCGYLHFSSVYNTPAREAQARGWSYTKLDAGHFHMLVEPQTVTTALLDLARAMGI